MSLLRTAVAALCVVSIGGRASILENGRALAAMPDLSVTAVAPRPLQQPAGVFDDTVLHDVRVFINSKDFEILRRRYRENIYMPADIVIDGTRVRNVAVRVRGAGSRRPDKMGLRVDFDYYTRGQRFQGLDSLILDNLWQDETMIREIVAMNVFRRMGQPAPREALSRMFLNNQYLGLYGLVEEIDLDFAEHATGEDNGYVYEYHHPGFYYHAEELGPGLDAYKMLFEPRSHELESDEQLYGPIRDLFHAVNEPDDAIWADVAGPRLDLVQFMTFLGIEQFLGEGDGILGYAGMNNFYLYRSPVTNKHRILPWDRDLSMRFIDAQVDRGLENVIFHHAFDLPDLRGVYLDTIESAARMAMDGDWLANEIERFLALADTLAREDTIRYQDVRFTVDGIHADMSVYERQIEFLRELARIRPAFLLEDVARFR